MIVSKEKMSLKIYKAKYLRKSKGKKRNTAVSCIYFINYLLHKKEKEIFNNQY